MEERPLFCRIIGPEKLDLSLPEDQEWLSQKHWAENLLVRIVDGPHKVEGRDDVLNYGALPLERQEIIPDRFNLPYVGFLVPAEWLQPVHALEIEAGGWQIYEHPQLGRQVYPMPDEAAWKSLAKRPSVDWAYQSS